MGYMKQRDGRRLVLRRIVYIGLGLLAALTAYLVVLAILWKPIQ